MIRLHVIAEGPTEETFVNEVLGPHLVDHGVSAVAILIGKTGGAVSYARLKRDALLYLKSDPGSYCTTLVDYYGLGNGFPGKARIGEREAPAEKQRRLEEAIREDVREALGKRHDVTHFIPYVQMYEFEGLLFSDPARMAAGIGVRELEPALRAIRAAFSTPEHINDSSLTAPSKRILGLYPGYSKEFQGNLAALEIGLGTIRAACPLFDAWVARLEALGAGDGASAAPAPSIA